MRKTVRFFAAALFAALVLSTAAFSSAFATDDAPEMNKKINEMPAFSDIQGHWAEETILKWKDAGFVNGYPDGTFRPDQEITRAELAKVITLAFGLTEATEYTYNDISAEAWYVPYLATASAYIPSYASADVTVELMFYQKQNCFFPDAPVLRMHAAETFSLLKMKHDGITVEIPDFSTVYTEVNALFADTQYDNTYVIRPSQGAPANVRRQHNYTWLANKLGVMQGDPNGYFRPFDGLTRAEVLTVLERILAAKP